MEKTMDRFVYFEPIYDGQVTELRLVDPVRFDVADYAELRDEVGRFVEQYRPPELLVDFSRVPFCSTAIMDALLTARKRMETYGGQLRLCGMNHMVRESFQRLNLDTVFEIHTTAAAVAGSFGAEPQ